MLPCHPCPIDCLWTAVVVVPPTVVAMPQYRNYENRFVDIADPTKPLKRIVREYEETTTGYQPPASSLVKKDKSRGTLSTKSNAYEESENDVVIKRLDKDVDALSTQAKTLRTEANLRSRQIKGLEDLLDAEREALQEVLEVAREKIRGAEQRKIELELEAAEESRKRHQVQEEMQTMQANHRTQVEVYETHIEELRVTVKSAQEQKVVAIKNNEEKLAAQRAHYEAIIASLREQIAAAEQRFSAEKDALTMANSRLRSMMAIWQTIISDLIFRRDRFNSAIHGFRTWRKICEYHWQEAEGEFEIDIQPNLTDFDPGSVDVKAMWADMN